jgi:hypothetical protein
MTALGPLLQQQQQLQQQQPSTSMVIQREEEGEGGNRSATSKYNPKNSQKKARKNATTVKNITADLLKNPSSSCEVQIPSHDKQGRPHPLKSGPFLAPTTTIIKTPLPLPPVLQVDHNHPNGCNGSVRGGGARTLVEIGIERELHEEEEGGEGENAGNLYANFPYSTTPLNGGQRPQNNKKRWKPRAVGVEQHQRGLNEGVRGAKPTKKKGAKRKATTVTATGLSSSPTKKKPCLRRCHFSSAGGGGATAASSSEKQHPFTLLSAAGPGANSSTSTATTAAATLVLRKSVQAYRQRRRELSYRHFKEVGMMVCYLTVYLKIWKKLKSQSNWAILTSF